jgi:acetyltransferase-like isoleucine patch superfamily enzyme
MNTKKLLYLIKDELKNTLTGLLYPTIDFFLGDSMFGYRLRPLFLNICGFNVHKKAKLGRHVKISKFMTVEEGTFINYGCYLDGPVVIGKYSLIGFNTNLISNSHDILPTPNKRRGNGVSNPPIIGDHVWIGANCTVLPGVTIGSGSIIGAGSVVTKDIPDNVIAVGVPCKVLKPLPSE